MFKRRAKNLALILLTIVAIGGSSATAANRKMNSLLIVPARYPIVQLSFDFVALRGVSLVSYEKNLDNTAVLYWWNWVSSQWQSITVDELATYSFLKTAPNKVYLIGLNSDITPDLLEAVAGAGKLVRIKTLNTVQVVNVLNQSMKFSQAEWEALAKRHNFKIKDWNYAIRRWGRYGPPGEKKIQAYSPAAEPRELKELNQELQATPAKKIQDSKSTSIPKQKKEPPQVVTPAPANPGTEKKAMENPFEEMERELDRMSKEKAAKGIEMIPQEAPPKAAPPPKDDAVVPETGKTDLLPQDLPPDGDFIAKIAAEDETPAPEDK